MRAVMSPNIVSGSMFC